MISLLVIDTLSNGAAVIGVIEDGEAVGSITNSEIIAALQSKDGAAN